MNGLTDLPRLFHFSPYTNRNRIGQWMCTGTLFPLVAQKLIFFPEFPPSSYQIGRRIRGAVQELAGVCATCAL